MTSPLAQVKLPEAWNPCEYRLVTLTCIESYQVLPSGGPSQGDTPTHCGTARGDCSSNWVAGKPGYTDGTVGVPFPFTTANCGKRACTSGFVIWSVSSARSLGLLKLSPHCDSRPA